MDRTHYLHLMLRKVPSILAASVNASDFTADLTDRTLILGHDSLNNSWHVYLQGGEVRWVVHDSKGEQKEPEVTFLSDLVKSVVRLYPECCDYEFCRFLKEKNGISLPFSPFDSGRKMVNKHAPFMHAVQE